MGSRSPKGRGIFGGCQTHWKALWVTASVYAAKKINNDISATAAADCIAHDWPVSSWLLTVKNLPRRCGLSSNFFDYFLNFARKHTAPDLHWCSRLRLSHVVSLATFSPVGTRRAIMLLRPSGVPLNCALLFRRRRWVDLRCLLASQVDSRRVVASITRRRLGTHLVTTTLVGIANRNHIPYRQHRCTISS